MTKLSLDRKHLDFLQKEFGITEQKLQAIPRDEWQAIREKCADIDVDEAAIQMANGGEYSQRGVLADKIIDTPYSRLFE